MNTIRPVSDEGQQFESEVYYKLQAAERVRSSRISAIPQKMFSEQ